MSKYHDALNSVIFGSDLVGSKALRLLIELVDKNERLVAHVKLAIKMLEENSPHAIETLKEVIEQDWSENE